MCVRGRRMVVGDGPHRAPFSKKPTRRGPMWDPCDTIVMRTGQFFSCITHPSPCSIPL